MLATIALGAAQVRFSLFRSLQYSLVHFVLSRFISNLRFSFNFHSTVSLGRGYGSYHWTPNCNHHCHSRRSTSCKLHFWKTGRSLTPLTYNMPFDSFIIDATTTHSTFNQVGYVGGVLFLIFAVATFFGVFWLLHDIEFFNALWPGRCIQRL